jgi:P27 family predicted phage terminase small subunit
LNELSPEERRARGTQVRASRARRPEATGERPRMPRDLTPNQRTTWREIVSLLSARGTLTAGDGPAIVAYAEVAERLRLAQEALTREGLVVQITVLDKKGRPVTHSKPNPYVRIAEQAERMLHAYRRELGLTPLTRDRVKSLGKQHCGTGTSPVLTILKRAESQ